MQGVGWEGEERWGLVGQAGGLPTLFMIPSFQKSTSYFRSTGGMQGGSWYVALTLKISSVGVNTRSGGAGSTGRNRAGPVSVLWGPQRVHPLPPGRLAPHLARGALLARGQPRWHLSDTCASETPQTFFFFIAL